MAKFALPNKRIMSTAFQERGRPDVVKIDALPIPEVSRLQLIIESVRSPWRQGVRLSTEGRIEIERQSSRSMQLWADSAPPVVTMTCHSAGRALLVYNMWDSGGGFSSLSWSSGMLVEEIAGERGEDAGRRYRCNDIGFDTNFDKLVFTIRRVG